MIQPAILVVVIGKANCHLILYIVGLFTGITALIGLIMAYVKRNEHDVSPALKTHFDFQIKTFWYGLIYLILSIVLAFIIVGYLLYIWWVIWLVVRTIKGFMALDSDKAVTGKDGFWGLGEFNLSISK
ncbi:DUF4870 family protein [Cysteiniphilum sp. JM-1]|uniref:DUF4870 family protein n=1 Tax=Cysteiniphilum sp. JM-1 TaxID=2610891 RepID=UPI001CD106C4|nr:hypothetical protein [Cysteiniphilum sp. JM-1]